MFEPKHPLRDKQEIPVAPENAPPITQEILQHLSLEIGLDDILLLDLRGRDPPPALGGNVIMVIGTARGVKHLNVSADRFCRWLRSTYKLRPYADGLLGRNELKIKLRRKARRARVASSTGTVSDTSDDGITTGWICVNVGSVDDPGIVQNMREGGFEGFGKVQGGTRIVVQMFTEEKRADVNLEQLWTLKEDVKGSQPKESVSDFPEEPQVCLKPPVTREHNPNPQIFNGPRPLPSIDLKQTRGLSTSAIQRVKPNQTFLYETVEPKEEKTENDTWRKKSFHYETVDLETAQNKLRLASLFSTLDGLPKEEVIRKLGSGPQDQKSTEFLRGCYSLAQSSSDMDCRVRLMLGATAVFAQHPDYTKEYLWSLFLETTAMGYKVDESLSFQIASAFLVPRPDVPEEIGESIEMIDFDIESAIRVMDRLSLTGNGTSIIRQHRIYNMMYKALLLSLGIEAPDVVQQKAIRLRALMDGVGFFEWQGQEFRETMQLRFLLGDLDGFYAIWHAIAFNEGARTVNDYELLFELHAEFGNPINARDCLHMWPSMMGRENPPILPRAGLVTAIARCAHVAGYFSDNFQLSSVPDEWAKVQTLILEEMREIERGSK